MQFINEITSKGCLVPEKSVECVKYTYIYLLVQQSSVLTFMNSGIFVLENWKFIDIPKALEHRQKISFIHMLWNLSNE